jgi:uncharacterized membrane protein YedE/YeeE
VDWLLVDYWPWWVGAPAFALLIVGMWQIERRLLGVSGTYTAALTPELTEDRALKKLADEDPAKLDDALREATVAEFGEEAVREMEAAMASGKQSEPDVLLPRAPLPRSAHLGFLAFVAVGGLLGSIVAGRWAPQASLGTAHDAFFGGGAAGLAVLLLGGFFVGFGTRMAGGCTTGHGFSGCSRLQIGSLVATASFFGTAVGVSFLLEVLR